MIKIGQNGKSDLVGGFIIEEGEGKMKHYVPNNQRVESLHASDFDADRRAGYQTNFKLVLKKEADE